jgi:hypothetical protein
MNPYLLAPGIRFDEYVFSEPGRLVDLVLPKCGGIVALLVRDSNWAPKPFQPLCFREFGNNLREPHGFAHTENLYVAVLPMPFSTAGQRSEILSRLSRAYNPVCQNGDGGQLPPDFARKLVDLERRHDEQNAQIRLLLETLNRFFEPQPEPLRRPIGFQPRQEIGERGVLAPG